MTFKRLLGAALLVLLVSASAFAVTPSDKYSVMPASTGLTYRTIAFESSRDRADLTGWWFEGQKDQPVIVLFGRGQGSMADLLPVVGGFLAQGFNVMTFDYRDFGPA
ncbi:MAG: hypothetical protein K8R56_06495, partial [Candidatus Eisenbacteria bacterium]|nr:hypothetical protein [Candidatus Eisenbacteria bacterium]